MFLKKFTKITGDKKVDSLKIKFYIFCYQNIVKLN